MKLSTAKLPTYRRTGGRRIKAPPEKHELKAQNLFPDEIQAEILDEVQELFDGTYGVVRPGPWKRAFRPSGFPYCPVLDAMSGPEDMDYGKAFYLDIGTTAHELMQEYMSRSPTGMRKVFANWKCKDCGGWHYFTTLPYACAHCHADRERLHYEELEFENFRGIQGGHVDCFIRTKHGWIVADWKTASTNGLDYRDEADGKHHHQLQAYCLALQELFKHKLEGLPIIGYMLIFVPRDKSGNGKKGEQMTSNWTPYVYLWNEALARATRRRLFMQRASFDAATIGYETGNWLPAAWLRPCTSLADFGKPMGMRDGFYGGELCPNLDICSRGSQVVADTISEFRSNLAAAETQKAEIDGRMRELLLSCADQGFVAPQLIDSIKAVADAEDYDSEKHEELLAIKVSLERYIAVRLALTESRVKGFFNGESPPAKALPPPAKGTSKDTPKGKTRGKTAVKLKAKKV